MCPTETSESDEIEITPEMVEVGVQILCERCHQAPDWLTHETVRDLFLRMSSVAPRRQVRP
jgi:hypothetical protein